MYGIIYKAIGPTGKVYVGQTTKPLSKRKADHKYRALKGDRRSPFQCALLDEGFDNFLWDEIGTAENQAELDAKERQWIAYYDSMNPKKGYNHSIGGIKTVFSNEARRKNSEAQKGKRHSEKTRSKMSEAHKGEKNSNYGKHFTDVSRKKISEARKGKDFGEQRYNAKITEATARQIKIDIKAGMRNCEIMKKHNVGVHIVTNIKMGRAWAYIKI